MKLAKEIKDQIISHSKKEYPNECGGIILSGLDSETSPTEKHYVVKEFENESKNPEEEFLTTNDKINPFLENLAFIYHTHTKGQNSFSTKDKMISEKLNVPLVLFDHKNNDFLYYEPNGFMPPLTGRSWEDTNSCDKIGCFLVVSDYYKKILKIEIPDYDKVEILKGVNLSESDITIMLTGTKSSKKYRKMINSYRLNQSFDKYLKQNDFTEVNDLKKHDIIGMKGVDKSFANKLGIDFSIHFAVYLQGGSVLHQPYMRPSKIEKLTNDYKSLIHKIYRHKTQL